jgi:sugar phosphate isomerase/epimerase
MKFSFSTLGCPSWSWGEIIAAAHDLGYDGIEIRGIGKELYAPHISYFQGDNLAATKQRLAELKLGITCLTSACYLFDKSNNEMMLQMGREYVDLAASLQAPVIRVLGDLDSKPSANIDVDFVAENLRTLARYAVGKNVQVLLESNGVFGDTGLLASVLAQVNEPQAGALWDVHHPYHLFHEPVDQSYANLRPYLGHLHMKDAQMENNEARYKMMGFGDIPNIKILELLQAGGYAGCVSLEWLKRWNKNLTEPGVVFPQFINYVRDFYD